MRREAREWEGLSGTEEELSMRTILTAPTVPILWPAFVSPLGWREYGTPLFSIRVAG
jgi:hypothetical protein